MERDGELNHFQLLEKRVDSLIQFIEAFKKEKESSIERFRIQEEKIADLKGDIGLLLRARDRAKQMISSLLTKIEKLEL